MTIAMITLTHAKEFGPHEPGYKGRTIIDAYRVESIEEVKRTGKDAVSFVTLQSGQAYTVAETPEQILELMGKAINVPGECSPLQVGSLEPWAVAAAAHSSGA